MAEDKIMVCAGIVLAKGETRPNNEKDCVAGGGRWMDEEDILLTGVAAAPGQLVATVRVVDGDETKMAKVAQGEVLVGEEFKPAHNIYLEKAAAIITDTGGILSHGGVAGKMFGIPAVAGTVAATQTLKDGQKVLVDGNRGLVLKYIPGEEPDEKPKPAASLSLADRMAAVAAKKGIDLPPGFTEKQKEKE